MKIGSGEWYGTEEDVLFVKCATRQGAIGAKRCLRRFSHFSHLITLGFSRST